MKLADRIVIAYVVAVLSVLAVAFVIASFMVKSIMDADIIRLKSEKENCHVVLPVRSISSVARPPMVLPKGPCRP